MTRSAFPVFTEESELSRDSVKVKLLHGNLHRRQFRNSSWFIFSLQFVREKGGKIQIYSLQELKKNSEQFRLFLYKKEHVYYNYYITQFVLSIWHISLELVTNSEAVLKVH